MISRSPEKIPSHITQAGVVTRKADFDDSGSLEHCFDGASCLVLISYPSIETEHRFDVCLCRQFSCQGRSSIFYTSLAFGGDCTADSVADVMHAHLKTERYLQTFDIESMEKSSTKSVAFTSIREGIYSESFPLYTGFPDLQDPADELKIPHDGSGPGIAFATIDDLGEATAKLIKEYLDSPADFKYINQVMLLSGPRAWSLVDIVKLLGEIKGKDIRIKQVSEEEYAAEARVQEMLRPLGPREVPKLWATTFDAVKKGECDVASVELGRLLGREPETFDETVKKMARG